MRHGITVLLLALVNGVNPAGRAAVDRWLVGNPDDARVDVQSGLLLMGGGGDVDEAVRWFLSLARGGDVVVLRASGSDGYNDYFYSELGVTLDSVETLRFGSRQDASAPDVVATIDRAEVIFLAGGDQSRYIEYWRGTPVGDALNRHLSAGRPMGGTSAGLAVLGEFVYAALHDGDLTSAIALEDPRHPHITIETDFLRIPFLHGILTDSHFSERSRLGRLMVMLARVQLETQRGDLLGLGIDERTALCVESDGTSRVQASGSGKVTVIRYPGEVPVISPEGPFGPATTGMVVLGRNSVLNLADRTVELPERMAKVRVVDGHLVETAADD